VAAVHHIFTHKQYTIQRKENIQRKDARHLVYVFPNLADKSTYMKAAHKFPLRRQNFSVFSAHITGIFCPVSYDTPARKLLGVLNSSLSKSIAADGEVMSDASYVTLHLHESNRNK
jgi:hypothetical protein